MMRIAEAEGRETVTRVLKTDDFDVQETIKEMACCLCLKIPSHAVDARPTLTRRCPHRRGRPARGARPRRRCTTRSWRLVIRRRRRGRGKGRVGSSRAFAGVLTTTVIEIESIVSKPSAALGGELRESS